MTYLLQKYLFQIVAYGLALLIAVLIIAGWLHWFSLADLLVNRGY